jgi:DNA-binding protein Fis
VEYTQGNITKHKIKKVAEELGIDEEQLKKKLKEINYI